MTQTQSATLPDIAELHVHFLAILPTIEQYAELAHRHLVNFHDREDAVADTVAAAWERFLQLAEQDAHQAISTTTLAVDLVEDVLGSGIGLTADRHKP